MPNQQNQSITPRNHRNKFPFHPLPRPQHQIGQYLTQSTTTTRHTHLQCHYLRINPCHHLRTSRCQCYPLRSTPTHGQGAPRLCHHHQSLSQDRSRKEQQMPPPAVWSTSSMPSPEGPMNQCTRRRDSAKNISEQCLMLAKANVSKLRGRMSRYLSRRQIFDCSIIHIMTPSSSELTLARTWYISLGMMLEES